jgi:hypothetical protein
MANSAPKPRPMRSKKSGKKKAKLINVNNDIIKKLLALALLIFIFGCTAPYKIIETYTTDSTGKTVKTVQKIYPNRDSVVVNHTYNDISLYPYPWNYYHPYYHLRPVIIYPRVAHWHR